MRIIRDPVSKHLDRVVVHLLAGLTTDGAHHKQYYLEQALRTLCTDDYVKQAKDNFGWDDGIPS